MTKTKTRDNRSSLIKKLLLRSFPDFTFKVRIDKYSGGESINVFTTMLKQNYGLSNGAWRVQANANPSAEDYEEHQRQKERIDYNRKQEERIKNIIGQYESIDYDMFGDVLQGGNTFLFVHWME